MESPQTPSQSGPLSSELSVLSGDSGLFLTASGCSGSTSSAISDSDESAAPLPQAHASSLPLQLARELEEEGSGASATNSLASDDAYGEQFDTLKKAPGRPGDLEEEEEDDEEEEEEEEQEEEEESPEAIAPPPEFQDSPPLFSSRREKEEKEEALEKFAARLVAAILEEALGVACMDAWSIPCSHECHPRLLGHDTSQEMGNSSHLGRLCWTPELPFSPSHHSHPHPSHPHHSHPHHPHLHPHSHTHMLTYSQHEPQERPSTAEPTPSEISDIYNVPFDSDIYAFPIDMLRPGEAESIDGSDVVSASSSSVLALQKPRRRHQRKKHRHASSGSHPDLEKPPRSSRGQHFIQQSGLERKGACPRSPLGEIQVPDPCKRHSVPVAAGSEENPIASGQAGRVVHRTTALEGARTGGKEPIHMTLQEVRQYLQTLYGSEAETPQTSPSVSRRMERAEASPAKSNNNNNNNSNNNNKGMEGIKAPRRSPLFLGFKHRRCKAEPQWSKEGEGSQTDPSLRRSSERKSLSSSLKHTLCSWFRPRHHPHHSHPHNKTALFSSCSSSPESASAAVLATPLPLPSAPFPSPAPPPPPPPPPPLTPDASDISPKSSPLGGTALATVPPPLLRRALPPLPLSSPSVDGEGEREGEGGERGEEEGDGGEGECGEASMDFASSIQKVKDYGWYWGPISGEAAEKILANEPNGSFIVRDSSDDHYIFSLTFKLNGFVRHVRIEHDQGNFSFGSCTKFKSHTIVDFIENAVEHSRSGRYLFFLHRRPVLGPMRVQLLHPVSRLKQVQSLQHMCRFVILKLVRRDLVALLPLPKRLLDYLGSPHYYAEQLIGMEDLLPLPSSGENYRRLSPGGSSSASASPPHQENNGDVPSFLPAEGNEVGQGTNGDNPPEDNAGGAEASSEVMVVLGLPSGESRS